MADPIVVKIGGGLLRGGSVTAVLEACREVAAMPGPVLVVPGGGPFAEAVRAADVQVGLPEPVTHAMALAAMDQFGAILAELLPGIARTRELTRPTGLTLLVAAAAFDGRPDVPQSWDVTSDSLAVLAAAAIGAREAILLKRVRRRPAEVAGRRAADPVFDRRRARGPAGGRRRPRGRPLLGRGGPQHRRDGDGAGAGRDRHADRPLSLRDELGVERPRAVTAADGGAHADEVGTHLA